MLSRSLALLIFAILLDEKVSFAFDYSIFGGTYETTTVTGINRFFGNSLQVATHLPMSCGNDTALPFSEMFGQCANFSEAILNAQ